MLIFGAIFVFLNLNKPENKIHENKKTITETSVNYKSSFTIYTNGNLRNFSSSMYHELSEDVFIDSLNPNIVSVKKSNTSWRDFFSTLLFELNEKCLTTGTNQTFCTNEEYVLQFYLNGERNQSVLDQTINPNDKLLVTYDREDSSSIQAQIQSILNP